MASERGHHPSLPPHHLPFLNQRVSLKSCFSDRGKKPWQLVRGRPRKGEEGVRRHAILQIKYTDGVENVRTNSDVQMILDRVYGRQSNDKAENSGDEFEEDKMNLTEQRKSLMRSGSKTDQNKRTRIINSQRTEFHPSNMMLGVARVNMENWTTQAQIETPQFRLLQQHQLNKYNSEDEEELTEDQLYASIHQNQENQELEARRSKKRQTRRIIRGKGAFKTPKRRGRPPRNKRKRKSQFAQTRSTLPQLSSYSLSEENMGQMDQQPLFYDYQPMYNEEMFPEEGEYESDAEMHENLDQFQEDHEHQGIQSEKDTEEQNLPGSGGVLQGVGRIQELQHYLEPRRRASSLSSNGLGSPIFPPSLEAWP